MCEQCEGLSKREQIGPEEYKSLAGQLAAMVGRGGLEFVTPPCCTLEEVAKCKIWPADVITHVLLCTRCGNHFRLFADTYHGNASWGPTNKRAEPE